MISVSNLGKAYGPQTLFTGASFQFNPGNRYGIVGANGSGKSTFLRILSGEEIPSEGEINVPKRLRMGVLKQDHFRYENDPILHVVMMGHEELWRAMEEKETILERADQEFDADRYAELEDLILRHDGYSYEARAAEVLEGLGIPTEVHREPLSILSGGFKLRVLLAQVLASQPDALFLDEPTNHLDILSIRWLEIFLASYEGLVCVISHDHRFLDNVCNYIVDVDYETIIVYPGNYEAFIEQKAAERERKEAEIDKQERKIAEQKAFIERFRAKATKARQAQSKQKQLDRIEIVHLPQTSRRYPIFQLKQRRPSGKTVLEIEHLSKAYDDKQVLRDVSFRVERGDRLAILGPNGIGKSTLLKILVDQVRADGGAVEWGYETHPGYFAQDHKELFDGQKQTVESWLWEFCPGEPVGFVRGKLGMVLFSGDEVDKKLGSLSGGESARLVFSRLGVQQPNVLLLDEPTNHLDLEAIEALVEGLKAFDGTMILVSHDRWFVQQLATRILEIRPDGIEDYRGSYEEYVEVCGDDHLDVEQAILKAKRDKKPKKAPAPGDTYKVKRQRDKLKKERDRLTAEIEKAEERVHAINEQFCNPGFFDKTPEKEVRKLEQEQKRLGETVDELMTAWETVESELAELEPVGAS
ncbi:MAG: ABC-F family ATP-binding cassette domain-containing protein [Acidobacteriota bacterium]